MRLISTSTLQLQEFFDDRIPPYAILSHAWGQDEVSYQDWLYCQKQAPPRWGWVYLDDEIAKLCSTTGYQKIVNICARAKLDGHAWIWIDTNCIDKTSSAELSDAINSMYSWYRNSSTCYAFLADVPFQSTAQCRQPGGLFARSRWFTRGWTLQELVAPSQVEFYSQDWKFLGYGNQLRDIINTVTGIPTTLLEPDHINSSLDNYSVAAKMSWAAGRTTTRLEDMAYCLLGIFDVNMPLLYGEGRKAFMRLQEEIIRRSPDWSFLLWLDNQPYEVGDHCIWVRHLSPIATGPAAFESCGDVQPWIMHRGNNSFAPTTNSMGLSLSFCIADTMDENFSFAFAPKHTYRLEANELIWLPLVRFQNRVLDDNEPPWVRSNFPQTFIRSPCDKIILARGGRIFSTNRSVEARSIVMGNQTNDITRDVGPLFMPNRPSLGQLSRLLVLPVFPTGRPFSNFKCYPDTNVSGVGKSRPVFEIFSCGPVKKLADGVIVFMLDTAEMDLLRSPFGDFFGVYFAVEFDQKQQPKNWTCKIMLDQEYLAEVWSEDKLACCLQDHRHKHLGDCWQDWSLSDEKSGVLVKLHERIYPGEQGRVLKEEAVIAGTLLAEIWLD